MNKHKREVYDFAEKLRNEGVDVAIHSENGKYVVTTEDQRENHSQYLTLREAKIFLQGMQKGSDADTIMRPIVR
jgi:hypothetical protein